MTESQKVEADPVLVEIVAGTLAAIEKEVETSIGRTSRSPMIRDAHDFRAADVVVVAERLDERDDLGLTRRR